MLAISFRRVSSLPSLSPSRATLIAQLVQSASGLGCTAIVLALCTSEQFGAFALVQAAALLILGIVDSAFLVPLLVRCAGQDADRNLRAARHFDGTVLVGSLAVCFLVAYGFWLVLPWLIADPAHHGGLATAVGVWGLGLVARDWLRQRQLVAHRYHGLVVLSALSSLSSIVAVVLMAIVWREDSVSVAALALSCAFLGLVPMGVLVSNSTLRLAPVSLRWRDLGRTPLWSFAAAQITWVQSQTYLFLVSGILGTAAAGAVAAARIAFVPMQTVVSGLSSGWLAELARARGASQVVASKQLLRRTLPVLALAFGVWAGLVMAAMHVWREPISMRGFDIAASLTLMWAVACMCACGRAIVAQTHRARGGFRYLAAQGAAGALLSVVAVSGGAVLAGPSGAIAGLALAELATLVWGIATLYRLAEGE